MLTKLYNYIRGLFNREPVHLAIVRRYADANGHYVGELYIYGTFAGVGSYRLVGCSLDSLPLDCAAANPVDWALDLEHDFLAPMTSNTIRVGAPEPQDNDGVRAMVARIPRRNIRLTIQNKFIEHVLEAKKI